MATEQKLNLSCSNFEGGVLRTFQDLLDEPEFTDVTLVSQDEEQIKVHKVILCSGSAFFRRIIRKNPHQHPLLILNQVEMKTLKLIINFIYLGQTEVENSELETFLIAAKDLEIKGLSNKMPEVLDNGTTIEIDEHAANSNNQSDINQSPQDVSINFKDESNLFSEEEIITSMIDVEEPSGIFSGTECKPKIDVPDSKRKYSCQKCSFTTRTPAMLKMHTDGVHDGVKYPCIHCEYKATQKSSLTRHMIRHSIAL